MQIKTGKLNDQNRLIIQLETAAEGLSFMNGLTSGAVNDIMLREMGIELFVDEVHGTVSIGKLKPTEPAAAS